VDGGRGGLDPGVIPYLTRREVVRVRTGALLACGLSLAILGSTALAGEVAVSYLGHSCFTIQAEGGPVIMINPYASYVPCPGLPVPADVVLITHGHIDHCPPCFGEKVRWESNPTVVWPFDNESGRVREGNWRIQDDLVVRFTEASHVTASGGGDGLVCLFSFEVGGIRFAHHSDLSKVLTTNQIAALGDVDVLFLPVGGAYTIDAAEAMTVVAQLPSAKVVLPVHYYVEGYTPWPDMAPLEDFTGLAGTTYTVREIDGYSATIDAGTLPRSVEVWALEFKPD